MQDIIPNLSIDHVIYGYINKELKILLIERDKEPCINQWSLPGGYIHLNETVATAANRILAELTGLNNLFLHQVEIFSAIDRYPANRVISILYCALVKPELFKLLAGSHAKEVKWVTVQEEMTLPFDHYDMIQRSINWIRQQIWQKPVFVNLLPEKFPLNQMQELYETFLGEPIDNRNFRKKVLQSGLVEKLDEKTQGGKQRPAFLYRLTK